MNCREAQRCLPGYLDDAIRASDRANVRAHLNSCAPCRRDLEQYRVLSTQLARIERVPPPANLALRIRVKASQNPSVWAAAERLWARALLTSQNMLKPLAVPATGGVLTAVGVFVLVVQSMLVGMPIGGVAANDSPLDLVQPAQLESLAPFPLPGIGDTDGRNNSGALLLEATLNAQGEVVFYKILSGPNDVAVKRQIDQVLLFSKFRPQFGFGRPMGGGRVLLNFNEVRVRG
jgi:hypothetical protein